MDRKVLQKTGHRGRPSKEKGKLPLSFATDITFNPAHEANWQPPQSNGSRGIYGDEIIKDTMPIYY